MEKKEKIVKTFWAGALIVTMAEWGAAEERFEVVSIRQHLERGPSAWSRISTSTIQGISGGRLQQNMVTLTDLIRDAYNVKSYQIVGVPKWGGSDGDKFDVAATFSERQPPSGERVRLMLQAMLAERFKLKVHHATRLIEAYGLSIAKGGPKLKPLTSPSGETSRNALESSVLRAPFEALVFFIGKYVDKPVIDETGLRPGDYECRFDQGILREELHNGLPVPSIFEVVESQLGLKLRLTKATIAAVVVDHAELPTPN